MIPTVQLGGLGRPIKRATGAAAGYLDGLAVTPRAVLSLRKLISTATTAIRVRRSNDNAEQDIGFSGNALDTASLASFVGANSAFITKFYDQTGNGEDLVQATASKQPRIVNAGTYDAKAVFDGTDDGMSIATLNLGAAYAGLYWKMALPGTYSGNPMICELSPEFVSNGPGTLASYYEPEGSKLWTVQSNCGGVRRHVYSPAWSALSQTTMLFDTTQTAASNSEIKLWTGGALETPHVGSGTEQSGNYATTKDLFVGCRANTSLFTRLDLDTLVIYNADTSSLRSVIEAIVA